MKIYFIEMKANPFCCPIILSVAGFSRLTRACLLKALVCMG